MIFAERGAGAFWNGRPAFCREARGLDNATVCHGSLASFAEIGKDAALGEVLMHARIGRTWSDAYGHMLVATGRADMMLDPIVSRWDVSAVAVIVQESGAFFGTLFAEETIGDSALSCVPGMQSELGTIFTK
jgi:myo-inositol-1(or 4)-monophosphatase